MADNPFLKYKQDSGASAPSAGGDNPFLKYKQSAGSVDTPPKPDSPGQDVKKTIESMPERAAAGAAMMLPNLINTAAEGPQLLGRGIEENVDKLIGINPTPHGELWHPFWSSEDVLHEMPGALRPHDPTTTAGRITELGGQLGGQIIGAKASKVAPETGVPQAVAKSAVDAVKPIMKDQSSFSAPGFKKTNTQQVRTESSAEERAQEKVVNTLLKAGYKPQEILDVIRRSKTHGLTVGEAAKNPKLLGLESKISGMNKPGGKHMRDFAEDRVNPERNTSVQERLRAMSDPMLQKMKESSEKIGKLVSEAPKTPVNMAGVRDSLGHEKLIPGTPVANTVDKINGYFDWAQTQGDTFKAWHQVKQNIWDLKKEVKNPSAPQKLDMDTVKKYYKKVNDVLSRRTPGLPEDLLVTGGKYAAQNDVYRQHLAGKTIKEIADKAPTGGTPSSTFAYIYRKLAGSPEAQEKLFGQMPVGMHKGMMDTLAAIKDAARGNLRDVSKSVEEGSASFPKSKHSLIDRTADAIWSAITRKDYDALAKALTNPDLEVYARKLGHGQAPKPSAGASAAPQNSSASPAKASQKSAGTALSPILNALSRVISPGKDLTP